MPAAVARGGASRLGGFQSPQVAGRHLRLLGVLRPGSSPPGSGDGHSPELLEDPAGSTSEELAGLGDTARPPFPGAQVVVSDPGTRGAGTPSAAAPGHRQRALAGAASGRV